MKKLVQVTEVENEGLIGLMGKNVLIMCLNYFYTGELIGVNDSFIMLKNPKIVYETGAFSTKSFIDAQPLPFNHYVMISTIESFAETDKK